MKKIIRLLLPIAVLALCVLFGRWIIENKSKPDRTKPPRPALIVDAVPLQRQDFQIILHSQGTVRPRTESTLIPEISGRIVKVSPSFSEGSYIAAGEVLLEVDDRNYRGAITISEANLAKARLGFEEERVRARNYETELTIEESTVAQTRLVLSEEQAKARQAEKDWERLNAGGAPDDLVLRLPQLRAARAAVAAAEARLVQKKRDMELRKPQLTSAEAEVRAAMAQLEDARLNLERTRIVAPYDGRILTKNVDVGQYITQGTTLARVYAVDYVEIRLPLTNRQLEYISIPEVYRGEESTATIEMPRVRLGARLGSKNYHWDGIVVRAEGTIDIRSRQLFVIAKVNNPYQKSDHDKPPLKIGQFIEADIYGKRLTNVFVLPRPAVREGREVLLVDPAGNLTRREIMPIWTDTESVIVDNNLMDGDLLCVTPIAFAVEGTPVTVRINGETFSNAGDRQRDGSPGGNKENRNLKTDIGGSN